VGMMRIRALFVRAGMGDSWEIIGGINSG